MSDEQRAVFDWISGPDTGRSSIALVRFFMGYKAVDGHYDYPYDPDDLGRCFRALDLMPSYRARLSEANILGPVWGGYIAHWIRLEELYRQEEPTGFAPLCYAAMKYIQNCVRSGEPIIAEGLEKAVADRAAIEAAKPISKSKQTVPFILPTADVQFLNGKRIDTVAKTMKALVAEYSSPCIRCKKKREPMIFGRFGPTPDRNMCDPCARLPA